MSEHEKRRHEQSENVNEGGSESHVRSSRLADPESHYNKDTNQTLIVNKIQE